MRSRRTCCSTRHESRVSREFRCLLRISIALSAPREKTVFNELVRSELYGIHRRHTRRSYTPSSIHTPHAPPRNLPSFLQRIFYSHRGLLYCDLHNARGNYISWQALQDSKPDLLQDCQEYQQQAHEEPAKFEPRKQQSSPTAQ